MRKLIFPLFFIILLAVGVSAEYTLISDNFGDSEIDLSVWNTYLADNVSLILDSGYLKMSSLNSSVIQTKIYINSTTSGTLYSSFKALNSTLPTNQIFIIALTNKSYGSYTGWTSTPPTQCGIIIALNSNGLRILHLTPNANTLKTITPTLDNDEHNIRIEAIRGISGTNTIFNIYYDNNLEYTDNQSVTHCNLFGTYAGVFSNKNETIVLYDNFELTTSANITYSDLSVGTWVGLGNSNLCITGYAEYGRCSLKPEGVACVLNTECLSNSCVGGHCTGAGLWSGIDNFVSLSFGEDETSLTFIAILIIVGLTIGIIFASKGHMAGIIAGAGIMFISTIFFMIVGWLPVFFVVALVLMVIIIVALLLILRG